MPSRPQIIHPKPIFPETIPSFLLCQCCHRVPFQPVLAMTQEAQSDGKTNNQQQQVECFRCCDRGRKISENEEFVSLSRKRTRLNEKALKQWSNIPVQCPHEECRWVGPIGRYESHVCKQRYSKSELISKSSDGRMDRSSHLIMELKCLLWDAAAQSKNVPKTTKLTKKEFGTFRTSKLPSAASAGALEDAGACGSMDGVKRKMRRRGGVVSNPSSPIPKSKDSKTTLNDSTIKKVTISPSKLQVISKNDERNNRSPKCQMRRPSRINMRPERRF